MKGELPGIHQRHELPRELRVEPVSLHQEAQHRAEGDGHRDDGVVDLGEDRVARRSGGEPARMQRIADGEGECAFDGLGSVRVAAGLTPGEFLLDATPPGIADRLARVAAGTLHRRAVEERKELFVHPSAKVRLVVPAAIDQRADHQGEDEPRLGELAGLEPRMVAAGFGVGVGGDPFAVAAAKLIEVVIPVGTEAEGIADEGPHDGAGGAVLDRRVRHGILLFGSVVLWQIYTLSPVSAITIRETLAERLGVV